MSCYVDLYCQQCDVACGLELNREHEGLAALIAARRDVQAMRPGLYVFRSASHDERFHPMLLIRVVDFFWEHDNHAIVVRDEYGQMSGPKETP